MIPNEKKFGPSETFTIACGVMWRGIVVAIPYFLISRLLPSTSNPFLALLASLAELLVSLCLLWLAVHWLFRDGRLGSNKLVVMKQVHYQQLREHLASNPPLDPVAPQSGAPVS